MFDCPEPSQTSPMSTSCNTTSAALLRSVTSNGPPRSGVARFARHLPSACTTASALAPHEPRMLTAAPGSPKPEIGTASLGGNTMWSPNRRMVRNVVAGVAAGAAASWANNETAKTGNVSRWRMGGAA